MRRALLLLLALLLGPLLPGQGLARAAELADATGRVVRLPDQIARVLPAGPPASVLLAALAPDLMLGWPMPLSPEARAALPPDVARLPQVQRVTGHGATPEATRLLAPDVIVDYGTVSPAYAALAEQTQQETGIPTVLLDGALSETPRILRQLGAALHRPERGETLARLAEALLALPVAAGTHLRVVYARGADGLLVASPGTGATELFARLGWTVIAPPGAGPFRQATLPDIAALDPDILVFADKRARQAVADSPAWRALRAVRDGHAYVAPSVPFGWVEEPPSLNRLLGLAWLGGHDAATLGAVFGAVAYGRAPSEAELSALADAVRPLPP